jgi:hypothetical protein
MLAGNNRKYIQQNCEDLKLRPNETLELILPKEIKPITQPTNIDLKLN